MLVISLWSGILCLCASLVASPSYFLPVLLALIFAALHFISSILVLWRTRSRAKWLLLLLSLPVAAFTLDNLGRLAGLLGLPSFRILI
jgi:hypothetical protein